jgi:hypothetical protein
MPNNISVTQGSGTTIATEDLGTRHIQLVKHERVLNTTNTITLNASPTQFSSFDAISTKLTLSNVGEFNGQSLLLESAILYSSANQTLKPSFRLLIFNADLSTSVTENALFSPSDTEARSLVAQVFFSPNNATPLNGAAGASGSLVVNGWVQRAMPWIDLNGSSRTLYAVLQDYTDPTSTTATGYTPVASEQLDLKLTFRQT